MSVTYIENDAIRVGVDPDELERLIQFVESGGLEKMRELRQLEAEASRIHQEARADRRSMFTSIRQYGISHMYRDPEFY